MDIKYTVFLIAISALFCQPTYSMLTPRSALFAAESSARQTIKDQAFDERDDLSSARSTDLVSKIIPLEAAAAKDSQLIRTQGELITSLRETRKLEIENKALMQTSGPETAIARIGTLCGSIIPIFTTLQMIYSFRSVMRGSGK